MDIGLLNVKICIQKNEVQVDGIGNRKNSWNDYYTCFATVSGEGGNESLVAGTITSDIDISFTVRYCQKISVINSTNYRIIFNGDIYNILGIDHLNFKKNCFKFKCQQERR